MSKLLTKITQCIENDTEYRTDNRMNRREEMKEITIDNWVLGGTVFLLIFTLGCYLWFQNQMAFLDSNNEEKPESQNASKVSQTETPNIQLINTTQPDESESDSSSTSDNSNTTDSSDDTSQITSILPEKSRSNLIYATLEITDNT